MPLDREPITAALIAALGTYTSFAVGDGDTPQDLGAEYPEWPYLVVHEIPGGGYWGSLASTSECSDFLYQVDAVGLTAQQARMLADKVRVGMLSKTAGAWEMDITPAAGVVSDRQPEGITGNATREPAMPHDVFTYSERYVVRAVPA